MAAQAPIGSKIGGSSSASLVKTNTYHTLQLEHHYHTYLFTILLMYRIYILENFVDILTDSTATGCTLMLLRQLELILQVILEEEPL